MNREIHIFGLETAILQEHTGGKIYMAGLSLSQKRKKASSG